MELLRRVIAKINTQMADLTASQRIAIGLCAVIIAGSLVWLASWTTAPELVPLLKERLTMDQIALIRQNLSNDTFRIIGDRVYVRAPDHSRLLWKLHESGSLPADTSITFSTLFADDSPFRPESENKFRRTVAKQNELARVIAASPKIKSAEVFISDSSNRRISATNIVPTASITITMNAGQTLDQEIVMACATLVAGAVPGLLPHKISVVDGATMRPFSTPDPSDAFAQGQLAEKKKHEDHLEQKIRLQLAHIPQISVTVSVLLDSSKKEIEDYTYAEPAVESEEASGTESRSAAPSGEAGVGPNVGQALTGNASGGLNTTESSTTKFQPQPLQQKTKTQQLPFAILRATASISIPHSYVANIVKKINRLEDDPTNEQVDQQFQTEQLQVRAAVRNIIMANDDDVTVTMFTDFSPAVTMLSDGTLAIAGDTSLGHTVQNTLRDYGPQAFLGFLALSGMFMLSRIAKRSADNAASLNDQNDPSLAEAADEELLTVGSDAVGMAAPDESSMLEAKEVSSDVLRANELSDQITKLVNEKPDTVASMVKKWSDAAN
jgi:flagellar biosynthesis/type III secretory pathway M-ring protein FliF/YscJ